MDLDITPRAAQVLHDLGARTIDDVCTLTRPQIEAAGCKARDVASVVQALFALGRRLRRVPRAKGPPKPRKGGKAGKSIRVEGADLVAQRAALLGAIGVTTWPGARAAGLVLGVSAARAGQAWRGDRVRPETLAAWSERAEQYRASG